LPPLLAEQPANQPAIKLAGDMCLHQEINDLKSISEPLMAIFRVLFYSRLTVAPIKEPASILARRCHLTATSHTQASSNRCYRIGSAQS
jgi:hypothetical protein